MFETERVVLTHSEELIVAFVLNFDFKLVIKSIIIVFGLLVFIGESLIGHSSLKKVN